MRIQSGALIAMLLVAVEGAGGQILGPVALRLPSSTRWLAMGNTAMVSRDDDVLFYNPAQLAIARGMSASGERISSSASTATVSSVTRFSAGGVAVGATIADYDTPLGSFPVTRGDMVQGGSESGASLNAALGFAETVKGFRVGTAVKYAEDHVSDQRYGKGAMDLGVAHDFMRYFSAGLAVQNIGTSSSGEHGGSALFTETIEMPITTTLGVGGGGPVGPYDITATAAVSMLRTDIVAPSGGAEVSYSWLDGYSVALRGGARRPDYGIGRWTAGAGLTIDRLSIDYALETLTGSRIAHRVGLRLR